MFVELVGQMAPGPSLVPSSHYWPSSIGATSSRLSRALSPSARERGTKSGILHYFTPLSGGGHARIASATPPPERWPNAGKRYVTTTRLPCLPRQYAPLAAAACHAISPRATLPPPRRGSRRIETPGESTMSTVFSCLLAVSCTFVAEARGNWGPDAPKPKTWTVRKIEG